MPVTVVEQPFEARVIKAIPWQSTGGSSCQGSAGGHPKVEARHGERAVVIAGGGLNIGSDAWPVEVVDVMEIVPLAEAQVPSQVRPPRALTSGGVPHQPLNLGEHSTQYVDLIPHQRLGRVRCYPKDHRRQERVHRAYKACESFADGPPASSVESVAVLCQLLSWPFTLVDESKGWLIDVQVVDVCTAEGVDVRSSVVTVQPSITGRPGSGSCQERRTSSYSGGDPTAGLSGINDCARAHSASSFARFAPVRSNTSRSSVMSTVTA